jgi:fumarate reductase subunit D
MYKTCKNTVNPVFIIILAIIFPLSIVPTPLGSCLPYHALQSDASGKIKDIYKVEKNPTQNTPT